VTSDTPPTEPSLTQPIATIIRTQSGGQTLSGVRYGNAMSPTDDSSS